jgi:hypothetical protein
MRIALIRILSPILSKEVLALAATTDRIAFDNNLGWVFAIAVFPWFSPA